MIEKRTREDVLRDAYSEEYRTKVAPVQGYGAGIPWPIHLEAYDAYRKKWGEQHALIDLVGRHCRGGFGVSELDEFVPGWRDRVSEIAKLRAEIERLRPFEAEIERLKAERDRPETADFVKGVMLEASHQRARWGADHDGGKTPFDWFWLIGYLAQKAASADVAGDCDKAQHHTISTAAALANWHLRLSGADTSMRPWIEPPKGAE